MKINFWTSTEYGGFMNALMQKLQEHGVDARQKYNISEHTYRSSRNSMERILLRIRQYICYPIQITVSLLFASLSGRKSHPVVVSTNTFFAPLLATLFNRRVVHLVYDLFPEAMIHSGKWKEGQLKVKIFRWLVGLSLKRSATNVFLGKRLKLYVESIHGRLPNSEIIAVGADESAFTENFIKIQCKRPIKILYCGNFGHMHDSQTIFDFWESGVDQTLKFIFHCSGPKQKELVSFQEKHKESLGNRLIIGCGLSQDQWVEVMDSADIALVTMSNGAEEVVMPSKTYSAMMAGQAILAIAPEESDLVDLIKSTNCGWWVAPGDVEGLKKCFAEINSNFELVNQKGHNALTVARRYYGQQILAKKWADLLKAIN